MKKNALLIATFVIGITSVSVRAVPPAPSVAPAKTMDGTIMCRATHASQPYTEECSPRSHFVFVSHDQVYDIKNQSFSGLRPLVGEQVVATAQQNGRSITILQLMELPK